MSWDRFRALLAILPVLVLLAPLSLSLTVTAAPGPMVSAAMIQIIQGGTDSTTPAVHNEFYALKTISYQIAPGDTRVWTNVPADSRDILVWTAFGEVGNESYGWETTGQMAGSFYVVIPSSFNYSMGKLLVHVKYTWTQDFSHGKTVIDVSEPNAFLSNGTYALMVYILKGYNVTGDGLQLTFDQTGSMSQIPEKDLYINATSNFDPAVDRSITISKPKASTPWTLYLGAAMIGVVLLLVFVYTRYMRPTTKTSPKPPGVLAPSKVEAARADPERRKELVDRKKKMLAEIEAIKGAVSKGTVQRDDAETELVRLRKEYKTVRNELNKIARGSHPIAPSAAPSPSDSKRSDEFELVLASLAKIDEDYEKGRLPESSYKSLRKDYLEKATRLMDEGDSRLESMDPTEAEKVKLMEAIIALDDEHARGQIEAKVYEDLRSSYKSELSILMKQEADQD